MDHFDVVIVGAGLSGIDAACHLREKCPDRSFTLLEGRDAIGGTWDLFRYPGIRSDSDMHTLGFSFKPWIAEKSIAESDLGHRVDRIEDDLVHLVADLGLAPVAADPDSRLAPVAPVAATDPPLIRLPIPQVGMGNHAIANEIEMHHAGDHRVEG